MTPCARDTALSGGLTHACPPDGTAAMPCCGLSPFDVPALDRLTSDPNQVTCGRASLITAHDPALVERLAKVCRPWVTFTAEDGYLSTTTLEDSEIAERALDLLAAEDRLREPGGYPVETATLRAERDRLRALTEQCVCSSWPPEGPAPECPVHGAVRAFNEACVEIEQLRDVIAHAYVDLAAGRLDEGLAMLRAAGEQR